jgi:hypothetical protein
MSKNIKYVPLRNISKITVKDPENTGKTIDIPADMLLGGKHYFKEGGELSDVATYMPARAIVSVTDKDGNTTDDSINGFWVKKEFKEIDITQNPFAKEVIGIIKNRIKVCREKKNTKNLEALNLVMTQNDTMTALNFDIINGIDSGLLDVLIEAYTVMPFSFWLKDISRPLYLLSINSKVDDDYKIEYDRSTLIMAILDKKYLFKETPVKKIAFSRTIPVSEQPLVMKLLDSFVNDDALRPTLMRVNIDNHNGQTAATATDANVMIHLKTAKEDSKLIAVNPKASKTSLSNYDKYPDYRSISDNKISEYSTYDIKKQDILKFINHCNAVIDYGITSAPAPQMVIRMPDGMFMGYNPELLKKGFEAMYRLGFETIKVSWNKGRSNRPIILLPESAGKNSIVYQNDFILCMPMVLADYAFNYFYYDIKTATVVTTPSDWEKLRDQEPHKYAKGGDLFQTLFSGGMYAKGGDILPKDSSHDDDDDDDDMDDMYAEGGDVPVSDPASHEQLYSIYNVKTGTDKHSAIPAQEVINIVKSDAGEDSDQIDTLEQAKTYLEQNGYLLDEYEHQYALGRGLADNMSVDDIAHLHGVDKEVIQRQLKMGIKMEMEHTSDMGTAREIVMDHLVGSPDYYTFLSALEDHFPKKMAKGGKIGFKGLAKKVSDAYVGKPVPPQYRKEYGATYSREDANSVGKKVAAKVYREQLASKG